MRCACGTCGVSTTTRRRCLRAWKAPAARTPRTRACARSKGTRKASRRSTLTTGASSRAPRTRRCGSGTWRRASVCSRWTSCGPCRTPAHTPWSTCAPTIHLRRRRPIQTLTRWGAFRTSSRAPFPTPRPRTRTGAGKCSKTLSAACSSGATRWRAAAATAACVCGTCAPARRTARSSATPRRSAACSLTRCTSCPARSTRPCAFGTCAWATSWRRSSTTTP